MTSKVLTTAALLVLSAVHGAHAQGLSLPRLPTVSLPGRSSLPHVALPGKKKAPTVPLTDANLAHYVQASHSVAAYFKAHPNEVDVIPETDEVDDWDHAAARLCDTRPPVRDAITSSGMSCKDYLVFTGELAIVSEAATLHDAGMKLPAGLQVAQADLDFYHRNQAAVTKVMEEIGSTSDKQP